MELSGTSPHLERLFMRLSRKLIRNSRSTSGIIENNAYVGIHSTIVGSVKVGKSATVGAGSVVIENVAASKRVFGNPAKAL